ncbi:MAG: hypothetical protein J5J04_06370 [Anaerolineae bacterium]|nr:hypothetical protein [Anaerolineae bacterium]
MSLNDRSTRTLLAAILATAGVVIGVNLMVNRAGMPDASGWIMLALFILVAALLLWNWREAHAAQAADDADEEEEEALPEPVRSAALPTPVTQSAPEPEPEPAPEPAAQAEPPAAPEPEPAPEPAAPEPEPEPAKTAKAVDFTVLEGIGPYYDKALHAVGFTSFADIAAADPDAILEKLLAANYRRHPTIPSWPKQAAFAAKGDWDGLEAFKQKLTAGRLSED